MGSELLGDRGPTLGVGRVGVIGSELLDDWDPTLGIGTVGEVDNSWGLSNPKI